MPEESAVLTDEKVPTRSFEIPREPPLRGVCLKVPFITSSAPYTAYSSAAKKLARYLYREPGNSNRLSFFSGSNDKHFFIPFPSRLQAIDELQENEETNLLSMNLPRLGTEIVFIPSDAVVGPNSITGKIAQNSSTHEHMIIINANEQHDPFLTRDFIGMYGPTVAFLLALELHNAYPDWPLDRLDKKFVQDICTEIKDCSEQTSALAKKVLENLTVGFDLNNQFLAAYRREVKNMYHPDGIPFTSEKILAKYPEILDAVAENPSLIGDLQVLMCVIYSYEKSDLSPEDKRARIKNAFSAFLKTVFPLEAGEYDFDPTEHNMYSPKKLFFYYMQHLPIVLEKEERIDLVSQWLERRYPMHKEEFCHWIQYELDKERCLGTSSSTDLSDFSQITLEEKERSFLVGNASSIIFRDHIFLPEGVDVFSFGKPLQYEFRTKTACEALLTSLNKQIKYLESKNDEASRNTCYHLRANYQYINSVRKELGNGRPWIQPDEFDIYIDEQEEGETIKTITPLYQAEIVYLEDDTKWETTKYFVSGAKVLALFTNAQRSDEHCILYIPHESFVKYPIPEEKPDLRYWLKHAAEHVNKTQSEQETLAKLLDIYAAESGDPDLQEFILKMLTLNIS